MKKNIIYACLLWASLLSCEKIRKWDEIESGVRFRVNNRTEQSYESAKFYIGKYENNGVFVPTDSLIEDIIVAADSTSNYGYGQGHGWIVDVNKIRPNRGGFLMKLSDGTDFYFYEFSEPYNAVTYITLHIYLENDSIYTTG
jgi:RecJ-like exonuclease